MTASSIKSNYYVNLDITKRLIMLNIMGFIQNFPKKWKSKYYISRFEDEKLYPEQTFKAICSFLGVSYSDDMLLANEEGPTCRGYVIKGFDTEPVTRKLNDIFSDEDIIFLEKIYSKIMSKYHYINYVEKEGIDNLDSEGKFAARVRLNMDAKVNKNTSVKARLTTGSIELGDAAKDHTMSFDLAYVEHKFGKNHMVDIGRYTQSFGDGLIYSSNFDGIGYTTQVGKVKVNAAYGYPTLGRFSKASKDNNTEMALINLSAPVNKHLNVGGMFAHVGTTNVKMGNGKTINDFNNVYGFNAQYNSGKFATNAEWVTATGLNNSDVWNVGVKWGDYKITKKNSWRVALDYYNQEKNAPVFKTQKYEGNDLYGKTRHEGYKAWQLSASYAPEKNVGITTYYGFHAKTQEGHKVNDYYRADLLFKF